MVSRIQKHLPNGGQYGPGQIHRRPRSAPNTVQPDRPRMANSANGVSGAPTDWQLSEEAQRQALAQLVNSLSLLDITQTWGEGKTSSRDGQRFRFRCQVLQRTYS